MPKACLDSGAPVVLVGDFNVMPTELDVYSPDRWVDDALFRSRRAKAPQYRYFLSDEGPNGTKGAAIIRVSAPCNLPYA
jgi:exonuclease III